MAASPASADVTTPLDLTHAFGTRSAWQLVASNGPPVDDPAGDNGEPGVLTLCLRRGASGPCDPQVRGTLRATSADDLFSQPHYLNDARIVRPHGALGPPLLLVQTASLHGGNGDQLILTQLLAYVRDTDGFVRVYDHVTGANNNQEVRFIASGPLQGDMISVDPTEDAPFGFWVVVSTLTPAGYQQVLRYRSATRYGDGNPLAVIDSEMPGTLQRLGVWRPGMPLPVPVAGCTRPHTVRGELWCG